MCAHTLTHSQAHTHTQQKETGTLVTVLLKTKPLKPYSIIDTNTVSLKKNSTC